MQCTCHNMFPAMSERREAHCCDALQSVPSQLAIKHIYHYDFLLTMELHFCLSESATVKSQMTAPDGAFSLYFSLKFRSFLVFFLEKVEKEGDVLSRNKL